MNLSTDLKLSKRVLGIDNTQSESIGIRNTQLSTGTSISKPIVGIGNRYRVDINRHFEFFWLEFCSFFMRPSYVASICATRVFDDVKQYFN